MPSTEPSLGSNRQSIVPPRMADGAQRARYSPGLVVGDALYVSGQVGMTEDRVAIPDPVEQFVAAFEGIQSILVAAGFSFEDVVVLDSFHTTFEQFADFAEVKDRFIPGPVLPTWTAVGVSHLAIPGLLAEVKCTAVKSR